MWHPRRLISVARNNFNAPVPILIYRFPDFKIAFVWLRCSSHEILARFCLIDFRFVGIKDTSPGRYNYSLTYFKTADGEKINLVNDIKISGKFPIFTYKDRRGRGKVAYLYKWISLLPLKKGNSAVKIDRGKGSRLLSLQCKEREFPRNSDFIPYSLCHKNIPWLKWV